VASQAPPRILYAAGPGDVIGTYRHWSGGRDDPSQVAITYSSQFYDLCRETGSVGYVISSHRRKEKIVETNLTIEHRKTFFSRGPAPLYHLGQVISGLRLVWTAIWFRADVAIVADGAHWFVLGLMPRFGIRVVPTLHCVLWPKNKPTGGWVNRIIRRLNARFFQRRVTAVLSLSNDITQQVYELAAGVPMRIIPFLPSYRPDSFGDGFGPPPSPPPFLVFYAGRMELNKGVFGLLDIARQFAGAGQSDVEFDLCGDGSQLQTLRQAAIDAGVADRFRCHGHSTKPFMSEMYQRCHVVIVPTTSDFVEGFNKVVAEAVLAGRPVITSSVCPALEYVREAVLEVPPDDIAAYGQAIVQLKSDPQLYEKMRVASASVRRQFYDPDRSWKAAAKKATQIR
jgi:glycosyltransferase involved in cell wall biosynthesis